MELSYNIFGGGTGNTIMENGEIKVICDSLDSLLNEPPTFIKLDIEGAEILALEGAKNWIKMYKPKLAICVYHKAEDIWQIPLWIHELVPEYRFYMKHHTDKVYETVLYATVD